MSPTTLCAQATARCRSEAARSHSARSSPRNAPRSVLAETAIVVLAVAAYFGARGLTESSAEVAVRHAHQVVALERDLGLYHEPQLQRLVISHDVALDLLNWIYIWGHWPVIAGVLFWLVRRHPPAFVVLRNALIVSGAIGIVVFVVYPVAPPRLAGLGLVDSITTRSHAYRVLQPPAFVNQYAAIPSLHVGWDLLMGVTLVRYGQHLLVRVIGVLLPLAMATAVVLTANHYLVDGVIGAAVALFGLYVAERFSRRGTGRQTPPGPAGSPVGGRALAAPAAQATRPAARPAPLHPGRGQVARPVEPAPAPVPRDTVPAASIRPAGHAPADLGRRVPSPRLPCEP